jgi:hypothetical protein
MGRLIVIILMLLAVTPVLADDITTEPRPRLENYANYNEFLAAMYAYKKQIELEKKFADSIVINIQLSEKSAHAPKGVSAMPVKSPELNSAIDTYVPPLIISGPEDLEMAIEAAKHFLHPVYTEMFRYQRTTAQSFPLKPLEVSSLQESAIGNGLKLDFSPDVEQQVTERLVGNSPEKKTKEQLEQADDMNEANLSALKKMEILGGGDVNIGPPVINNVDISVEYRP